MAPGEIFSRFATQGSPSHVARVGAASALYSDDISALWCLYHVL